MSDEKKNFPDSLPASVFYRLVTGINNLGVKCLHVAGGGEPTLYPHLEYVPLFSGLKVLSTNGRLLTRATASMFDRIRLSLNAGSSEVHSKMTGTGPDEFPRILKQIEKLARKPRSYELGLGFVAEMGNWQDIGRACKIADEYELDFIHIRPAFYKRGTSEEKQMRKLAPTIYSAGKAAENICRTPVFNISEKFEGFWSERKYKKCLASPLIAVVTASGHLVVCTDVFIRFGNLHKQEFSEIWGSAEHKKAIAKINIGKCPRCIMNRSNEIMEHVFINNEIKKELL